MTVPTGSILMIGIVLTALPSILLLVWFVIRGAAIALLAGMRLLVVAETFIPSGSDHRYLAHGERKGLFSPRPAGVTEEAGRRLFALPPSPEPAHRLTPDILHLRIARGAQASR